MKRTDFLVIGSGVAGLAFAIKVAERFPDREVTVVTKSLGLESNTRHAQGGIAVVMDPDSDSFEKHVNDTLTAGDGLCDPIAVRTIVSEGPDRLREVMAWGARFDHHDGRIGLAREGGHSENRIVHHGDSTGLELSDVLLARIRSLRNVRILKGAIVTDLIMGHWAECIGATVLNTESGAFEQYFSPMTVLATGGIGQVYATTTNPTIATGDGIAMAHRAGAHISGMEFIQFHPTALAVPSQNPSYLISEAVRGAGARLLNAEGEAFMKRYHPLADLAPRDIVARAVFAEMRIAGSPHVMLDCTGIPSPELETHFPNILAKCLSIGIDLRKDPVPVAPAAHYLCGGIATDLDGRTSIKGLYAIGECADTGLHGANRLASNSLLEALVMAHRASLMASEAMNSLQEGHDIPRPQQTGPHDLVGMRRELRGLMDRNAGIIRNDEGLRNAMERLDAMSADVEILSATCRLSTSGLEVRNLICVARLIVSQSLGRKENRGGFFNEDAVRNRSLFSIHAD